MWTKQWLNYPKPSFKKNCSAGTYYQYPNIQQVNRFYNYILLWGGFLASKYKVFKFGMGGKTNELLLTDISFCEILCAIGHIIIKDNHIIVCFILCLTLE